MTIIQKSKLIVEGSYLIGDSGSGLLIADLHYYFFETIGTGITTAILLFAV